MLCPVLTLLYDPLLNISNEDEFIPLGGFPYPSIQNEDLLSLLRRGYRMEKPDNCSSDVYVTLMKQLNHGLPIK